MPTPRMNINAECPHCRAPLDAIEREDGLTVLGRYQCGALQMAFRDPRKSASIRLCHRLSQERASRMAEQRPEL